jgi:hypothetical protein
MAGPQVAETNTEAELAVALRTTLHVMPLYKWTFTWRPRFFITLMLKG